MATYRPSPIDTSPVSLTSAQAALVEVLAANVHDVWASKRIADGWQFGKTRDDAARTYPCLVPYEDLPELESL